MPAGVVVSCEHAARALPLAFRDLVPEAVRETLGRYPELGSRAAERIPDAVLVPFPELGHLPHIEAPERFNAALVRALDDQGVPAAAAE